MGQSYCFQAKAWIRTYWGLTRNFSSYIYCRRLFLMLGRLFNLSIKLLSYFIQLSEETDIFLLLNEISFFPCRFQVKKKQFFHNFLTIMSFGVLGVFISFSIISVGDFTHYLMLSSNLYIWFITSESSNWECELAG